MKAKYNQEYLLHSLPDYINNKIDDNELISEIERELQINPDFKNEYTEISNTLSFLESAELESPNENYFNNLSVNINKRLNPEEITESIGYRFGLIGKLLLTFIPIILIAFFIYKSAGVNSPEISISQNKLENSVPVEKDQPEKITGENNLNKAEEPKVVKDELTNKHKTQKIHEKKRTNEVLNLYIEKNSEDIILTPEVVESAEDEEDEMLTNFMADNSPDSPDTEPEEEILFPRDDGDNYEEELLDFTPDEQKEILENLNNSQI